MAEAFLRLHGGGAFEAFSAGTEATSVRPEAVAVMAELGIDISGQHSKTYERYIGDEFEWVVTVCDHARQTCPVFPGRRGECALVVRRSGGRRGRRGSAQGRLPPRPR